MTRLDQSHPSDNIWWILRDGQSKYGLPRNFYLTDTAKNYLPRELLTAVLHKGLSSYLKDWITHPQLEFIIEAKQDNLQAWI